MCFFLKLRTVLNGHGNLEAEKMKYFKKIQHLLDFRLKMALVLLLVVNSCMVPVSKKSYIGQFEKFVDRIEKEHEKYEEKDWKWADSQFEKFSGKWYDDYRDELSLSEKLHVQTLVVRYEILRGRDKTKKQFRKYLREDAKELREKVEEYLQEDADEDLEKLKEGMKEIGDSAVKVFEDIVKSLEEKLDN